jgi:hypothetical protein
MTATTVTRWAPCLVLEGAPLPDGITTSYLERLPGLYDTAAQAMAAAGAAIRTRPDAIGYSAKQLEVRHEL